MITDLFFGEDIYKILLKDQTSQQNIYWATNSYEGLGEGYSFFDPITFDKLCIGENTVINPRAIKTRDEKTKRTKEKAEVFTPSWVCNIQNNLIDEVWFGRQEGLFNNPDPNDTHKWINNEEKIAFPNTEGKTWKDYVADMRMEITCGEAPYLCNRYDVVSGDYNDVAKYRIGLLDRKLRIVSENTNNTTEWLLWGKIALRTTYGFEWQGDNLLLARMALLNTFIEHFIENFNKETFNKIKDNILTDITYIISWNIWQMDGLTNGLPKYHEYDKNKKTKKTKKKVISQSLFGNEEIIKDENNTDPHKRFCVLKDFLYNINIKKDNLSEDDFNDQQAPTQTFQSLLKN